MKKAISSWGKEKMRKPTYRAIMGLTLLLSGLWALGADLIYGSKAQAEEYLFGVFMINFSTFTFTVFTIMCLLFLIYRSIIKISPDVLNKIVEENKKGKKK